MMTVLSNCFFCTKHTSHTFAGAFLRCTKCSTLKGAR